MSVPGRFEKFVSAKRMATIGKAAVHFQLGNFLLRPRTGVNQDELFQNLTI